MSTQFNFPDNPTLNQLFVLPNGSTAQWNGTEWVSVSDTTIAYPLSLGLGGTGAATAAAARFSLGLDNAAGQRVLGDGTAAVPSLAFASEPGMGMFRRIAGQIDWTVAGATVAALNGTATGTTLALTPKAVGGTNLFLGSEPSSAANSSNLQLAQTATGPLIASAFYGTATEQSISYAAASHVFASRGTVSGGAAHIILDKTVQAGAASNLWGRKAGAPRWVIVLGDAGVESGSNAGSNFAIAPYSDAGASLPQAMTISRADSLVTVITPPTADRTGRVATTAFVGNVFASLLSTNGYQKFPSGLIMQWGASVVTADSAGNFSFTYPLQFPSVVYSKLVANGDSGINAGNLILSLVATGGWLEHTSTLAANARVATTGAAYVGALRVNWMAFGV